MLSTTYHFDINSEDATLQKFYREHSVAVNEESFRDFNKTLVPLLEKLNLEKTEISESDESNESNGPNGIKIGDIVKLEFIPQSQKYISYYSEQNVCGRIIFIDEENDDALIYRDMFDRKNNKNIRTVQSFNREYCSYYGTTRGYDHIVRKMPI
jgi:hypothetical protein